MASDADLVVSGSDQVAAVAASTIAMQIPSAWEHNYCGSLEVQRVWDVLASGRHVHVKRSLGGCQNGVGSR